MIINRIARMDVAVVSDPATLKEVNVNENPRTEADVYLQ
jgi:hypothetical protein